MKNKCKKWLLLVNLHYTVLIFMIIVLIIGMGIQSQYFLTLANLDILVNNFIMEAIMALGMTMVIISGGTDLSIAGIVPFTAIIFVKMMLNRVPVPVAMAAAMAGAVTIGVINNGLRKHLKLHPMVVTMATMLTLKGFNLALTGGRVISGFSAEFQKIGTIRPLGLSLACWCYLGLAIIFLYFASNSKKFIQVYFVGGNRDASELSGMKVEKVFRRVYMMTAALAGLAGILMTTIYNSASFSFGQGVELKVITAVAIGGTSLTHGGKGTIAGTMLGTLFMAIIYNAFVMSGMSTYYQDVVTGALLITAVLLSEAIQWLKVKNAQSALE